MTKSVIDADTILKRATPITHQEAYEIQPFGHLVHMPIALSETTCKESVQEKSLADCRADFLPAASSVRQAL